MCYYSVNCGEYKIASNLQLAFLFNDNNYWLASMNFWWKSWHFVFVLESALIIFLYENTISCLNDHNKLAETRKSSQKRRKLLQRRHKNPNPLLATVVLFACLGQGFYSDPRGVEAFRVNNNPVLHFPC